MVSFTCPTILAILWFSALNASLSFLLLSLVIHEQIRPACSTSVTYPVIWALTSLIRNNRTALSLGDHSGNTAEAFSLAAAMETPGQHLHWLLPVEASGWFPHWLFSFHCCCSGLSIYLWTGSHRVISLLRETSRTFLLGDKAKVHATDWEDLPDWSIHSFPSLPPPPLPLLPSYSVLSSSHVISCSQTLAWALLSGWTFFSREFHDLSPFPSNTQVLPYLWSFYIIHHSEPSFTFLCFVKHLLYVFYPYQLLVSCFCFCCCYFGPFSLFKLQEDMAFSFISFLFSSIFLEAIFPVPRIENFTCYVISKHFVWIYVICPHCWYNLKYLSLNFHSFSFPLETKYQCHLFH